MKRNRTPFGGSSRFGSGIEVISGTLASIEYEGALDKWFTVNYQYGAPAYLTVNAMLGVSTGHGSGIGFPRGFKWELPGVPILNE